MFPRSYREFLLMTNGGRLSVRCGMHAIPADDSTAFEVYDFLSIRDRKPRALEYSPFWLDVYEEGSPATYFPNRHYNSRRIHLAGFFGRVNGRLLVLIWKEVATG